MDSMEIVESKRARMCSSSLAENQDLLTEVLLKLPVKSLLRFALVSKEWHALIKSPDFIRIHQSYLHSLNPNLRLMNKLNSRTWENQFLLLGKEDTLLRLDLHVPVQRDCFRELTYIVGSSNGLVCLGFRTKPELTVIWNPATGQHTYLPLPSHEGAKKIYPLIEKKKIYPVLGFGFINNRYKVVRISRSQRQSYLIQIFTRGEKSWREVKDCIPSGNSYLFLDLPSKSINGVVYWLENETGYVFSFNLRNEVLHMISLPLQLHSSNSPLLTSIYSWKNSIVIHSSEHGIWVMTNQCADDDDDDECGIQIPASWNQTKLEYEGHLRGFWNYQILFTRGDFLYAYDPESKKERKLYRLQEHSGSCQIKDYAESLIPV